MPELAWRQDKNLISWQTIYGMEKKIGIHFFPSLTIYSGTLLLYNIFILEFTIVIILVLRY